MIKIINDKELCQKAFLPYSLAFIAANGLTKCEITSNLFNKAKDFVNQITNNSKLHRRIDRAVCRASLIFYDKKLKIINAHKFILALHGVAEKISEKGELTRELSELFEPFLEIEAAQKETVDGKEISDSDWIALKASANKRIEEFYKLYLEI
jgi:hypothetical protein